MNNNTMFIPILSSNLNGKGVSCQENLNDADTLIVQIAIHALYKSENVTACWTEC